MFKSRRGKISHEGCREGPRRKKNSRKTKQNNPIVSRRRLNEEENM